MKADDLPGLPRRQPAHHRRAVAQRGDLLMAGCLDTQFSWDTLQGPPQRRLHLLRPRRLPAGASYAQWFKAITPPTCPPTSCPRTRSSSAAARPRLEGVCLTVRPRCRQVNR